MLNKSTIANWLPAIPPVIADIKQVTAQSPQSAPPVSISILISSRYYSTKNKEEVSNILDAVSDAINKLANPILQKTELALNNSPWDRPGEDTAPYLTRMDDIVNETIDLHRSLYDDLYNNNPDYRIELNSLLFPTEDFVNFQKGASDFRNGLAMWSTLNSALPMSTRNDFQRLVNATRMEFGQDRDKFLAWLQTRQDRINQTRRALRDEQN